jgi:anaerobic magnesium-protoporphyrin IX monomethyl ester cyclase
MKYALLNPSWSFDGSIYFGCREPHLPLEYGYAKALLERNGHDVLILDGQLGGLVTAEIVRQVEGFAPDISVITTAPSYLFWRCAPPELRVPQELLAEIGDRSGLRVGIGPHASTTPRATLRKLGCDAVVMGEAEDILPMLAAPRDTWSAIPSIAYRADGEIRVQGGTHACNMEALPALEWPAAAVLRHGHHHHRFDATPERPGAEMETSRGCPYHCTFCAKDNFRNAHRKRPLQVILEELDRLVAQGIEYVYFIDEIFLPNKELLESLVNRPVRFGVQTRIDLWNQPMIDLLGAAGCVSIEAGVESISERGRNLLDKKSRLTTEQISDCLIHARTMVPFVQANLLDAQVDDPEAVERWRQHLIAHGVWANKPVPLFPYPGSPDYSRRWGVPDDEAWERAVNHYLESFDEFSDIQDARPVPLAQLEHAPHVDCRTGHWHPPAQACVAGTPPEGPPGAA